MSNIEANELIQEFLNNECCGCTKGLYPHPCPRCVITVQDALRYMEQADPNWLEEYRTALASPGTQGVEAEPIRDLRPALLQLLKDACDRDWKDETPEQIIRIAANGLYWRDQQIAKLQETPDYENGYAAGWAAALHPPGQASEKP